jgi:hypothetical protein
MIHTYVLKAKAKADGEDALEWKFVAQNIKEAQNIASHIMDTKIEMADYVDFTLQRVRHG